MAVGQHQGLGLEVESGVKAFALVGDEDASGQPAPAPVAMAVGR